MRPELTADGGWRFVLTPDEADLVERAAEADEKEQQVLQIIGMYHGNGAEVSPSCLRGLLNGEPFYTRQDAHRVGMVLGSMALSRFIDLPPRTRTSSDTLCKLAKAIRHGLFGNEQPDIEQSQEHSRIVYADGGGLRVNVHKDEADEVYHIVAIHLNKLRAHNSRVRGLAGDQHQNETALLMEFLCGGICTSGDVEARRTGKGASPLQFYAAAVTLHGYAQKLDLNNQYPPYHGWMVPLTEAMISHAQKADPDVEERLKQAYLQDAGPSQS